MDDETKSKQELINELIVLREKTAELEKIQDDFRLREERYRMICEHSDDAILLTAPDGRILAANPAACRMFGRTEAEICQGGRDAIVDTTDPQLPSILETRARTGKFRGEVRLLRRDGQTFLGEGTSVVFLDKDGELKTSMIIRDTSERKRIEEALRESEGRYKRLVENSPDIVWSFSDKRGTLYASARVQAILGYSPDQLYENPWLWNASIHLDDGVRTKQAIADFAAGGDLNVEYRIKNAAGDWLWFHDRSIGRRVQGSEAIIEGISTNITLRKRAYDELNDREKELEAIYESAPLIMLIVDKEWRIKKTNVFIFQLTGKSAGDLMDVRCGEALCCIHALDTPEGCGFGPACRDCALRLTALGTIETGQSHHGIEVNMLLSDGEKEREKIFLVSTKELVVKGNPMALVSIQDITKRKKMEDALRESESKYRFLAATADSMYLVDREGVYLFMNEGHAKRFALIPEQIIGRNFGDFHSAEATREFMDKAGEVFMTGRSVQHEHRSEREGRYFIRTFSPVMDQDEWATVAVSVVSKDITDRKKTEEMLRSSREQLRALARRLQSAREEERKQIAREIHDDLGGAMTGLKIDLSHISACILEIENETRRESCLHAAKEMTKLIDTTIASLRRIMMEIRPSILDDFGLVAAIEWHLQDFQKRTGIQCEFVSTLEEIDLREEHSTAVYRIFQESLTNVARHANATKVTVTLREKSGSVILEVKDNGKGIHERQVSDSNSLGLLGMKERALILGGTVDIAGLPGKGTLVVVQIPSPNLS